MAMMRPATATVIALGLKLFARGLVPLGAHLGQRDRRLVLRGRELVGIRRLPQLLDLLQLFLAQLKEIPLKFRIELHASFSKS